MDGVGFDMLIQGVLANELAQEAARLEKERVAREALIRKQGGLNAGMLLKAMDDDTDGAEPVVLEVPKPVTEEKKNESRPVDKATHFPPPPRASR